MILYFFFLLFYTIRIVWGRILVGNSIQVLRGSEIENKNVQEKIEAIHNSWIGNDNAPFEDEDIEFNVNYSDNEYCILGSDWFLYLTVEDDLEVYERKTLYIDFFEAMKTCENSFRRSVEMYMTFKMLGRKYKDFFFETDVNSYSISFYELFLRKGLIRKYYEEEPSDSKYRTMEFTLDSDKLSRIKP